MHGAKRAQRGGENQGSEPSRECQQEGRSAHRPLLCRSTASAAPLSLLLSAAPSRRHTQRLPETSLSPSGRRSATLSERLGCWLSSDSRWGQKEWPRHRARQSQSCLPITAITVGRPSRAPSTRSPPWCVPPATEAIRRHGRSRAGRDGGRRDVGPRNSAARCTHRARRLARMEAGDGRPARRWRRPRPAAHPSRQLIRPPATPWLPLAGGGWAGAPCERRRGRGPGGVGLGVAAAAACAGPLRMEHAAPARGSAKAPAS